VTSKDVDGHSHEHASADKVIPDINVSSGLTQFWELDSQGPVKITVMQDCLKKT